MVEDRLQRIQDYLYLYISVAYRSFVICVGLSLGLSIVVWVFSYRFKYYVSYSQYSLARRLRWGFRRGRIKVYGWQKDGQTRPETVCQARKRDPKIRFWGPLGRGVLRFSRQAYRNSVHILAFFRVFRQNCPF